MTEPPLNLDRGFTVSVYFPPGSDPVWVSDFLSRVAEDAYMPSETLDAFVVGHAADVLGIDSDEQELTHPEALELVDDLGQQAYRAEDRLAFVREMCDQADREQRPITTEQVRAWTQYTGCGGAIELTGAEADTLAADLLAGRVKTWKARIIDAGREPAVLAIPNEELEPLLALAEEPPPVGEMTAELAQRLEAETAMSGVDTSGCDCEHDGLGLRWHASDCAWRKEQR